MRSPSFFSYLIVYAVMFEQIGYTQANGTIYLHERDENAVLLHRENSGVVLMGSSARPTGASCFGNKTPKECAHSGLMRFRVHSRAASRGRFAR